jgi:acetyl esterase/lipase
LKRPGDHRAWVFVGSNIGIQYRKDVSETTDPEKVRRKEKEIGDFHNVYINPQAYEHYTRTGKFPDKTMLVMDVYEAKDKEPKNIVSKGYFPGNQLHVEVAVKNSKRPDGSKTDWAYYAFPPNQPTAKAFPDSACYQCHLQHADDDNVWVQFYPTLRVHAQAQGANAQQKPQRPAPTHQDVKYGPHERNVLDFWQAESKKPAPLLVSIHGGGFVGGNKSVAPQLLKQCLDAGISVAAISYRYSTQAIAPAPFQDGARAVQFLRSKAKEWNIDPTRIAATGGSAGAGISLWLAFHDDMADPQSADAVLRQSTRLSCAAAFDGQTSYDPRFIRTLFPGKDVYKIGPLRQLFDVDLNKLDDLPADKYRLFEEVSPLNHLTKDDPPVLLSYSSSMDADITNQGIGIHHPLFGKVLKDKMDALKIPCELYPANKRVGGGSPMSPIDFLKKYLLATDTEGAGASSYRP